MGWLPRGFAFKEDATRMTVGNTGKVMVSINNLVIASSQMLVCCSYLRDFFIAHDTLFPTLVKPCPNQQLELDSSRTPRL